MANALKKETALHASISYDNCGVVALCFIVPQTPGSMNILGQHIAIHSALFGMPWKSSSIFVGCCFSGVFFLNIDTNNRCSYICIVVLENNISLDVLSTSKSLIQLTGNISIPAKYPNELKFGARTIVLLIIFTMWRARGADGRFSLWQRQGCELQVVLPFNKEKYQVPCPLHYYVLMSIFLYAVMFLFLCFFFFFPSCIMHWHLISMCRVEYKIGGQSISRQLYSALTSIQMGLAEDKMGWTVVID